MVGPLAMHCEQARQLFDAYLDGELSPSLATELGAHRIRCADCRQALALMEVSGHILRSDREPVIASADFTDRLLACVETGPRWPVKLWHMMYYAAPLAAAAVIALAFFGVFDRGGPSQVAGVQQVIAPPMIQSSAPTVTQVAAVHEEISAANDPAEQALNEFVEQTQQRMRDKEKSLQRVLDLTILQMLDILEEAKERSQSTSGPAPARVNPSGTPVSPLTPPVGSKPDAVLKEAAEPQDIDDAAADEHPPVGPGGG